MLNVGAWADGFLALYTSDRRAVWALEAMVVSSSASGGVQEATIAIRCPAVWLTAVGSVLRVVFDQLVGVLLEQFVAPRSRKRGEPSKSSPDVLKLEAWAFSFAAWHGMVALDVDCPFYCEAEAILAVLVIVALEVSQRVQLSIWLLADHALGHVVLVGM
jgi:hypothetical protein